MNSPGFAPTIGGANDIRWGRWISDWQGDGYPIGGAMDIRLAGDAGDGGDGGDGYPIGGAMDIRLAGDAGDGYPIGGAMDIRLAGDGGDGGEWIRPYDWRGDGGDAGDGAMDIRLARRWGE